MKHKIKLFGLIFLIAIMLPMLLLLVSAQLESKTTDSLSIGTGLKIDSFAVSDSKITDLDYKSINFDIKNTFEPIRDGTKQSIYIKNNQIKEAKYNFSTLIQIDYNIITWAGEKYLLTDKPLTFKSYTNKDGDLIIPSIFFDDKYNKKINYKDIVERGGYALAYEKDGKDYIELRIDNLNLKSGEQIYIDPEFINQSSGFSGSFAGATPTLNGIATNGSDFWVLDITDNWVYHLNSSKQNQTDGFGFAGISGNTPAPRGLAFNGSCLLTADDNDDFVYFFSLTGSNLSGGFTTATAENTGISALTTNGSDYWVTDGVDDFVYHYDSSGSNMTDGFSTGAAKSNNPIGILYNGSDYWIPDNDDDFMYVFDKNGLNTTNGFDLKKYGISFPHDMASNLMENATGIYRDLWIPDETDAFVYHIWYSYLNASHSASPSSAASSEQVTFMLTINVTNPDFLNAILYFNGTAYNYDTKVNVSTQVNFTRVLVMPSVSDMRNMPYYWAYTTDSFENWTDIKNLVVANLNLIMNSSCLGLGYNVSFNFSFLDEQNLSGMMETLKYNIKYGLGGNNSAYTSYGILNDIYSTQLCINASVNSNYSIGYGELEYYKEGWGTRKYYLFSNTRATNITANISLISLNNAYLTSFLFIAKDYLLNPYRNYYFALLRWYPENNSYKIVEMARTNDLGQTVMNVYADYVDYRIGLYNTDGSLIKLMNPSKISCIETPCTFTITVTGSNNLVNIYGVETSITRSGDIVTFVWNDPSQATSSMRFSVWKDLGYSVTSICNDTGYGYTGVLNCNISGYKGLIVARGYMTASPEQYIQEMIIELREIGDKTAFLLFQLCLSLLIIPMFFWHPAAAILMSGISLIPSVVTGTLPFQAFIGVGVIIFAVWHMMERSQAR